MFAKFRGEPFWAGLCIFAWLASLILWISSPLARALDHGEPVVGLLFGTDQAYDSEHSDTLLLVSFDPRRKSMDFLSIPRDTRVNVPGYRFHRVNEVFGYHLRISGSVGESSRAVLRAVEAVLSTETIHVQIPYYIHIDYNGFMRIVDLVGGVWIDITEPMDYDDKSGGYHFHAKPGRYHFMGADALRYVRYRGPSGDKGRILRQHAFIRTVFKRTLTPTAAFRFPLLLSTAWRSIDTNIGWRDMLCLALDLRTLQPEHIGFKLLPGTTLGPYWMMDHEAAHFVVQQFMGKLPSDARMSETIRPQRNQITVNVWNASHEAGMAKRVAMVLRRGGFDVLEWGNFDSRQHSTRVIDRGGNLEAARKVAEFLQTENLHSEINQSLFVDVEVIVGEDYHGPVLPSSSNSL